MLLIFVLFITPVLSIYISYKLGFYDPNRYCPICCNMFKPINSKDDGPTIPCLICGATTASGSFY